jgi:hypothetical protein
MTSHPLFQAKHCPQIPGESGQGWTCYQQLDSKLIFPGFLRYCLNYKGIPHHTEWVEFPDIAPLCKELGIPPTGMNRDGTERFTLPAIHDPATGIYLADSIFIAEYLDKQYPNTPRGFPENTMGLHMAFSTDVPFKLGPLFTLIVPPEYQALNPRGAEYFRHMQDAAREICRKKIRGYCLTRRKPCEGMDEGSTRFHQS